MNILPDAIKSRGTFKMAKERNLWIIHFCLFWSDCLPGCKHTRHHTCYMCTRERYLKKEEN